LLERERTGNIYTHMLSLHHNISPIPIICYRPQHPIILPPLFPD